MRGTPQVFLVLALLTSIAAAGPKLVPGTVGLAQKEVPVRNACTKTFTQVKKVKGGDEASFVAAMTFPRITGLDMDPKHEARSKKSLERFNKWVGDLMKVMDTATKMQSKAFDDAAATPAAKIEAAARTAILMDQMALIIESAEIPRNIRSMPEGVTAYCDTLAEKADPIRTKAKDARAACAKFAADAKLGDAWWVPVCTPPAAAP